MMLCVFSLFVGVRKVRACECCLLFYLFRLLISIKGYTKCLNVWRQVREFIDASRWIGLSFIQARVFRVVAYHARCSICLYCAALSLLSLLSSFQQGKTCSASSDLVSLWDVVWASFSFLSAPLSVVQRSAFAFPKAYLRTARPVLLQRKHNDFSTVSLVGISHGRELQQKCLQSFRSHLNISLLKSWTRNLLSLIPFSKAILVTHY